MKNEALAAERARQAEEKAEAERKAKLEAERVAEEKRKAEEARIAAERAEVERKAEAARLVAEKADAERKAKLEAERLAEEKRKAEEARVARERELAAAKAEIERLKVEKNSQARLEAAGETVRDHRGKTSVLQETSDSSGEMSDVTRPRLTDEKRAEMRMRREQFMAKRKAERVEKALEIVNEYISDVEVAKQLVTEVSGCDKGIRVDVTARITESQSVTSVVERRRRFLDERKRKIAAAVLEIVRKYISDDEKAQELAKKLMGSIFTRVPIEK